MSADLFERFLGVRATDEAPLLLGVRSSRATEGEIVTALQERLTQIAAHPDGLSPEADEVRLALHAAAAQMLGQRANEPRPPARGEANDAPPQETQLEASVILVLASMGGWNARSRERILALAHSQGVPPERVVELAERLVGRSVEQPARLASGAGAVDAPANRPREQVTRLAVTPGVSREPKLTGAPNSRDFDADNCRREAASSRIVRNLIIFVAIALFGSAAMVVLFVSVRGREAQQGGLASESGTAQPTPAPQATELFPVRPQEAKVQQAPPASTPRGGRVGDWDDLLRAAAALPGSLESNPEQALAEFEKVYTQMSRAWGQTSGDGLLAAVDRLVEFFYRASNHEDIAGRALTMVIAGTEPLRASGASGPEVVLPSAWSVGVLARLSRERDLPGTLRNRVLDSLSATFPGATGPGESTFRSGATAGLMAVSRRLASIDAGNDQDVQQLQNAWRRWLEGLAAISGEHSPLQIRQVVLALDGLLVNGPEPTSSRAAFQAITTLAVALPWRKDDETRQWLLRWFDNEQISTGDLYALTAALAGQSGAEGVDSSMILSAGAGALSRAEMRDRYAAMWGLATGDSRDALLERWTQEVAQRAGAEQSLPTASIAQVHTVVEVARLSRAAELLWSGETEGVAELLEPEPLPRDALVAAHDKGKSESLNHVAQDDWTREYLAAGHNIPQRRELIARIHSPPDAIMCEILVEEACRGTPYQLRQDARVKVSQFISHPAMLNALVEFAPLMPITRDNAALVEEATLSPLPALRDPAWRVAVRRNLVETLLQVMAGKSALAYVDRSSDTLALLYQPGEPATPAENAPQPPPPGQQPAPAPTLTGAAAQQRIRWQREAELLIPSSREPYNLAHVERRRRARAELAFGRIQEFEAEQVTICELMAYICVAEQPTKADAAASILGKLEESRRACRSVFEQLVHGELARLRLWHLRFAGRAA